MAGSGPSLNILRNVTAGYRAGRGSGGGGIRVRLSPSWRTATGLFARPPVGPSLDTALFGLGQDAVRLLANATPVRTGNMRAGWRSTLVPSQHRLRIYDQMPYWPYVVWGTYRMRANPNLQRVIRDELPRLARVQAGKGLRDISIAVKG